MPPLILGQRVQRCLGLAPCRQNARDRLQAERAVLHGPLQRRQDIRSRIGRCQRQDAFRLVLTGAGTGQQALQEVSARWAELRIPRREVFQALLGITGWLMVRAVTPLADDAPGEESMACRGAER